MDIKNTIPIYLNNMRINNSTEHDIKNSKYYLKLFARFILEYKITEIEDITYTILKEFQEDLSFRISRYGTLWKIMSQNRAITQVKTFLRWLVVEDYLASDPSEKIRYAKEPDELPRNILDDKEIKKMFDKADTKTLLGYRNRVILEILYSTGIRKSELENLKLSDVDYIDGYMRIEHGKNRKDRVVPLGKIACKMIETYIVGIRLDMLWEKFKGQESEYLFTNSKGKKLHHDTVWELVKKYAKQAGIKKKITPHCIRHTCATHMLKNGAPIRHIQEMLGHVNITTTERYTRVTINDLKIIHDKYHPSNKQSDNEK